MVAEIARDPETHGLPISIGGVTTRDAQNLSRWAAARCRCTAAMTYGFKIIDEMTSGLSKWMTKKAMPGSAIFRAWRC